MSLYRFSLSIVGASLLFSCQTAVKRENNENNPYAARAESEWVSEEANSEYVRMISSLPGLNPLAKAIELLSASERKVALEVLNTESDAFLQSVRRTVANKSFDQKSISELNSVTASKILKSISNQKFVSLFKSKPQWNVLKAEAEQTLSRAAQIESRESTTLVRSGLGLGSKTAANTAQAVAPAAIAELERSTQMIKALEFEGAETAEGLLLKNRLITLNKKLYNRTGRVWVSADGCAKLHNDAVALGNYEKMLNDVYQEVSNPAASRLKCYEYGAWMFARFQEKNFGRVGQEAWDAVEALSACNIGITDGEVKAARNIAAQNGGKVPAQAPECRL